MTTLNKKQIPDLPVSKITGLDTALSNKVTATNEVSKLYGTDESGNQVTYNLDEVGGSDGETIRNQNTDLGVTSLLYNWEGTFQQYIEQDIEHLHPEWICLITDDIVNGSIYTPDLLDTKWSDYLLDNPSWVLSDGEWKSKTLYPKIYEHLRFDYLEVSSDPQTETINEITITYYLANDGHKIVLSDQLLNVEEIYENTGITWYYILDTENERFKLPRTKFAFEGIRTAVGNYIEPGLPNITGTTGNIFRGRVDTYSTGAFKGSTGDNASFTPDSAKDYSEPGGTLNFNASNSNPIYGNSTTVQSPATEMYLYFYAGTYHATNNNNEIDILEAIYPVGSLYFGTQTVCPMEAIMSGSTWVKLSESLTTNVEETASVIGTGNALGLTSNGSNMYALGGLGTAGLGGYFQTFSDNTTLGSTSGAATRDTGSLGVSTDPTKSGIVANISSDNITVNVWKRTA